LGAGLELAQCVGAGEEGDEDMSRLQDELLRIACRVGVAEDERERMQDSLARANLTIELRDQEIMRLKAELAAFPLLE
jgi:hypothetical protein